MSARRFPRPVYRAHMRRACSYWGLAASYFGIWLFFVGLTHGLSKIAFEAGSILPAAFTKVDGFDGSPIWSPSTGKFVVMIFSFSLGFCATLAGDFRVCCAWGVLVLTLQNMHRFLVQIS